MGLFGADLRVARPDPTIRPSDPMHEIQVAYHEQILFPNLNA